MADENSATNQNSAGNTTSLINQDPALSGAPPEGGKPPEGSPPPEGGKAPEGEAGKVDDAAGKEGEKKPAEGSPVIPEKYELRAPEGTELNEALLEQFTPIAKELKLDNEGAQKLADLYGSIRAAEAKQDRDAWLKQNEDWMNAVRTDAEIGGTPEKLQTNLNLAQQAVAKFGSPELKAELDATGLGNHPELIRFCMRVGKASSEDQSHSGAAGTSEGSARSFYPNSNMK